MKGKKIVRTKKSFQNISVAVIGQFIGILLQFISRRIFINTMSAELLGVNSIFSNLLAVLSLAEMGVGSAITFSLYKPLLDEDKEQICSIMDFYKKVYRIIALIVLIAGTLITPFFPIIIKEDIKNIYVYYFLYLASSVVSYLCAYKRTLIIADQKSYISSIYRYTYIAVLNIVQIFILIETHNYALFLVAQIVLSYIENVLISKHADKIYPYLKNNSKPISENIKQEFYKNIRALLMHRIGTIAVTNVDNILLSAMVNIRAVAVYANYKLVFSGINTIMNQIFTAITASVGNLLVQKSKDYSYQIYKTIEFITCWIFGVISICLIVLLNDFIGLWVGTELVEGIDYVVILVVHFFITGIREPTNIFKNALGLFWNDRYKAVIEAIVNLILSIILGVFWGARGIFFATILSALAIPFWIEPFVLYKNYFKKNITEYFSFIYWNIIKIILVGCIIWGVMSLIIVENWVILIVKAILCFGLANFFMLLFNIKTAEFNILIDKVKQVLNLRLKKSRQ